MSQLDGLREACVMTDEEEAEERVLLEDIQRIDDQIHVVAPNLEALGTNVSVLV